MIKSFIYQSKDPIWNKLSGFNWLSCYHTYIKHLVYEIIIIQYWNIVCTICMFTCMTAWHLPIYPSIYLSQLCAQVYISTVNNNISNNYSMCLIYQNQTPYITYTRHTNIRTQYEHHDNDPLRIDVNELIKTILVIVNHV